MTFIELYFALLLIFGAVALVVNRFSWAQILGDIENNHAVILLSGAFALFVGLFTVFSVPAQGLSVHTITLVLGWFSVLKGASLFVLPAWAFRLARGIIKPATLHSWALFMFTLGVILLLSAFDVL